MRSFTLHKQPAIISPRLPRLTLFYRMLGQDGNSVEELRELIAVPPRIEWALRAYLKAHREEQHFIARVIKFREAVARKFECLVRDGVQVDDLQDLREVQLDVFTERRSFRAAVSPGRQREILLDERPTLRERRSASIVSADTARVGTVGYCKDSVGRRFLLGTRLR